MAGFESDSDVEVIKDFGIIYFYPFYRKWYLFIDFERTNIYFFTIYINVVRVSQFDFEHKLNTNFSYFSVIEISI